MKKILYSVQLILILMLLIIGCQDKEQVSVSALLDIYVDSLFQESIDNGQLVGGTVLVAKGNDILLKKSYGYGSLELRAPMPDNAQFDIGSVTKQFTAAAILKLVEDKKLSLEDDFTDYLEFDTRGRRITIKNLLDHTSGIPSYTGITDFWALAIKEYPRDTLVRLVENHDFLFEPNTALIYNNSGYFFLGLIIEKITGLNYEEYLKQTFFEPLGMDNTYYGSNTKVSQNKVYGYTYKAEKGMRKKAHLVYTWPFAAGALCSSSEDLFTWMYALHNGKVLSDSSYLSMITPGHLKDGTSLRYAKGLVNYQNNGHTQIAHGGAINGFLSETRYFPDNDLYIICLLNTAGPKSALLFAEKITWQILDKQEPKQHDIDIDTKDLEGRYTGLSRGAKQSVLVETIQNGLILKEEGSDARDTFDIYIGDRQWINGTNILIMKEDGYHMDKISGHFIFKKEK